VEPEEEAASPIAIPAVATEAPPKKASPPVGFRNPVAVRVALLSGIGALLFNFLPLVNWVAAGFFAVFFYRRKTRDLMDVGAGLQIGWITGLVTFTVQSVFYIVISATGTLRQALMEQAKGWSMANDPNFLSMAQFLASPPGVLVFLAFIFVFITCLTMAGAALGAKLIGRS
jgi:FtsH-binding integral membrane protein